MQHFFAPMEGLTDRIYRQTHHAFFPGMDGYYMPFLSPTMHHCLTAREQRELPPAEPGIHAVPQILTKNAADFLWAAEQCRQQGYDEVNLNAGCPSGTVVAKGKGAGLLADPKQLDAFLNEIFSGADIAVSVKTRIGVRSSEEFPALLEVYNRYPISRLIVHPRVRGQFYKGRADRAVFRYCLENSRSPLCYNGDLFTLPEVEEFRQEFPGTEAVMIGRGLIGNPAMFHPGTPASKLEEFHDALLEQYLAAFGGSRNAMFRMKEHWQTMLGLFEGSEKLGKQLRKTTDLGEYRMITHRIFRELPLRQNLRSPW